MKLEYKRFASRVVLLNFMKSEFGIVPFDRNFWCFTYDEKEYRASSVVGFAQNINSVLGEEVLLAKNCRSYRGRTTLCFIKEADVVIEDEPLITLEPTIDDSVVEDTTIIEGDEPSAETLDVPVSEDVVEESVAGKTRDDYPDIDWERIDALTSSKDDKLTMETIGKSQGVDLKRNMSIANMIKAFEEFLGIK